MTERWRKKLGDLDKQGPSDEVFERARQGPMHAEDPVPHVATSRRIVTAVAAFAVFALAISVFAIPALRMQTGAAGGSSGLFPLWPSQTPDQLKQLQAQAEAGDATWALDPESLATRFAQQVLGWQYTNVDLSIDRACPNLFQSGVTIIEPQTGDILGTMSPGMPSPWASGVGCVTSEPMYPYLEGPSDSLPPAMPPATSSSATADGSFLTFRLTRCAQGEFCESGWQESVTVYQPLAQGVGNIWAVYAAQSDIAHLSVLAGQNVRSGATVSGTFNDANPALGFSSCGTSSASSAYEEVIVGMRVSLDARLPASASCEGEQAGYVWGAVGDPTLVNHDGTTNRDPIADGSSCGVDSCLEGLTAVPVIMTFPEVPSETTALATPTTSDEPTGSPSTQTTWSTIDDVMGWTMSYPSSWTPAVFGEKDKVGHAVYSGDTGPLSGVVVDVWTDPTVALTPPFTDDSTFPLDPNVAIESGTFRANGLVFHVDVSTDGTLTPEDDEIVHRIVSSITFKPWQVGDVRNDWVAISTPTDDVSWITVRGGLYMLFRTPDGYKLYGAISCVGKDPSKTSARSDGFAVLECPDGSTWEMNADGASGGSGDASRNDPPPEWPVVTAFDGSAIAYVIPGEYPPGTGLSS